MFERMVLIRAFETHVATLYRPNEIPGLIHTSVGQEAVAVGIAWAFHHDDYDVAGAVELLLSDDGAYITGQTLAVDGGMSLREHARLLRSAPAVG